jgi:hypothetical protein
MSDEPNLIIEPAEVRQLWNKLDASIPAEKERARREGIRIAEELKNEGGHKFDGGGQKMLSIDMRTYIRWQQEFPGCWQDQGFIDEFLRCNPQYCAPGYRPPSAPDYSFVK